MWTEHNFVIWSCNRSKGEVLHKQNWFKPPSSFFCGPFQGGSKTTSVAVLICSCVSSLIYGGVCFVIGCSLSLFPLVP